MATNDTPSDSEKRAVKALTDVVAVEQYAPGMVRVVTWSDSYIVDARGGGCNCPDKEYNIHESDASQCKHEQAAMLYDSDMVQSLTVDDDLSTPSVDASGSDSAVATDGGEHVSDLHDELQSDIADRAPYANGSEYVAGPPEGHL